MYKRERMSELLLSFLSEHLRELGDPRLQQVSFTEVQISKDCKHAHIFWSAFKSKAIEAETGMALAADEYLSPNEQKEVEQALLKAKALFRKRVADHLTLRYIPNLHFKYDETAVRGMRIDALLNKVNAISNADS